MAAPPVFSISDFGKNELCFDRLEHAGHTKYNRPRSSRMDIREPQPGSKLVGNFLGDGRATAGNKLQFDAVTLLKNLLQALPQFGARRYRNDHLPLFLRRSDKLLPLSGLSMSKRCCADTH